MAEGSRIEWDMGSLRVRTEAIPKAIDTAIGAVFNKKATDVQDYARRNAPWTDRTSNARNGLFAKSGRTTTGHEIVLYHTVPYGIWLEVRFAGKNAIIMPTIQQMAPEVMKAVSNLFSKMGALS